MALASGTKLGAYEIQSLLGAGGMGEVYRVRDTRLDRQVAIKILPPGVSANGEGLRRFELEARAASALNHPSIITIHELGREGSTRNIAVPMTCAGKALGGSPVWGSPSIFYTISYGSFVRGAPG